MRCGRLRLPGYAGADRLRTARSAEEGYAIGGATCADVLALIEKVRKTVYDAHGVMLEPEVKIIR